MRCKNRELLNGWTAAVAPVVVTLPARITPTCCKSAFWVKLIFPAAPEPPDAPIMEMVFPDFERVMLLPPASISVPAETSEVAPEVLLAIEIPRVR